MLSHVVRFAVLFCLLTSAASAREPNVAPQGTYAPYADSGTAHPLAIRVPLNPIADDNSDSPVTQLEAPARRAYELIVGGGFSAPECSAPWGTTCLLAGSSPNATFSLLTRPGDRWAWGVQGMLASDAAGTAPGQTALAFVGMVARFELADAGSVEPYIEGAIGAAALASSTDEIGPGFRAALGIDWRVGSALRAGPSFAMTESFLPLPEACGAGCAASELQTTFSLDLRFSWAFGERL